MKICKVCKEEKPLSEFYEMPSGKLGRAAKCKPCYIEHYKKRYSENAESLKAYQKQYGVEYRKKNLDKRAASKSKRRAANLNATPPWLSKEQLQQIQDIYSGSKEMNTVFPWAHQVDHIVPLVGKGVCGLHVPWNLQILTAKANASKGNRSTT
jgi:5-methylcytosine-specific restriction endonuclease McrA